jgi:hypothetical protein
MAKRFTDSTKWQRENFRKLPVKMKLAWIYLVDNCAITGVWPPDFGLMSFQLGEEVSEEEFLKYHGNKVHKLPNGAYFIPSYIEFQQGLKLYRSINAHKAIIELLDRYDLYFLFEGRLSVSRSPKEVNEGVGRVSAGADEGVINPPVMSSNVMSSNVLFKDREIRKPNDKTSPPDLKTLWNSNCQGLPKTLRVTGKRQKLWATRWAEEPDPEYWASVIKQLATSAFCNGHNDRGWKASVDFLLQPDTHVKALEGKYRRTEEPKTVKLAL